MANQTLEDIFDHIIDAASARGIAIGKLDLALMEIAKKGGDPVKVVRLIYEAQEVLKAVEVKD